MPAVAVMQQVTDTGNNSVPPPAGDNNNTIQQKTDPATAFTPTIQRKEDTNSGGNNDNLQGIPRFQITEPKNNNVSSNSQPVQRFEATPKQNDSGMPGGLRSGIEQLSGISMGDVKVNYNSSKPAQLNAHAYAQGTDIHLGPGQEKHLPHEAWHVVQQKQDRVKPTLQMKSSDQSQPTVVQRVLGGEEKADMAAIDVPGSGAADSKRAGTFVDMEPAERPQVREAWGAGQQGAGLGLGGGPVVAPGQVAEPVADQVQAPGAVGAVDDEKKQAGISLNLSDPSRDEDVVKRRTAAGKAQRAIVLENKTSMGEYKSGFVKTMKNKMVDIVKDIQEKHGQMEQAHNYINGDAGVNAFFFEEMKKADSGEASEAWTADDKTAPERHEKLAKVAGQILSGKHKTSLVGASRLNAGPLENAFIESKDNLTKSKDRLEKTTADKAVVEMYYNQLASLQEQNDEKNEDRIKYFEEPGERIQREDSKRVFRAEAQTIFGYGFIRQADTKARHTEQKVVRKKLETEERITSTSRRAAEAAGMAVLNVLVKTISLGIFGVKKNRDKRGFVSGSDFSMDDATFKATKVKLKGKGKGGKFEFTNVYNDYVFARDELKAKWTKRQPMGKHMGFALVLEGFRKFIDAIQSIFSSLSLALTAVGLIPGVAPIVAPVIAFCSSVVLAIGLAKVGLSSLITLINAIGQIFNTNPELFAEMSGETAKSGINAVTDAAGIGVAAAIASSGQRKLGAGTSFEDKVSFNNPAYEKGFGMTSDTGNWFAKQGITAGTSLATGLVPKVTNAAITASGNLDNNDMTYSQTVNEERRIGKKQKAKGDLLEPAEAKHIKAAAQTTQEKANTGASQLRVILDQIGGPPAPPDDGRIPEEKREAGNRAVEIGGDFKREAGAIGGVAGEIQEQEIK
ncbi:MAG: DUF4157 domain-containing protein [Bacteroidota bacterium]